LTAVNRQNTVTRVPHEPTTQVAFRLADRMLARIDRHAKRMGKDRPGLTFTRADAVRDLLTQALESVEDVETNAKRIRRQLHKDES